MINRIFRNTLAVAVLLFVGCDGLLDISPQQSINSDIATNSPENLQSVLIGGYDALSDDDIFGGEIYFNAALLADDDTNSEITFTGTFSSPQEVYAKAMQVTNGQAFQTWAQGYFAINQVNTVLANIETFDEADRDQKRGEALLIRGSVYFELAKMYAPPYSAGSTSTAPGVPIVLTPDNFELVSRSTLEETYQQVLDDLTEARDLLSTSNGVLGTSHVANAILSRVYLQMGDYEAAATAANAVIESGDFMLTTDFADAFNNSENSTEDVFAMQVSEQDGAHALNTYFGSSAAGGRGDVSVTPAHLAEYEAGDARASFFYNDVDGDASTPLRTTKWQNQFANIPVIRLAEMYLTRAEGNLRSGAAQVGPATPLEDVNMIRSRAGLADLGTVAVADVLQERKLELAFEGQLLNDLKRNQMDVGSYSYDAPDLVFPIPQAEIDVNSNLTQNAGYTGE
jgi:tetratricopeptide (TPR) repeat protein